MIYNYNDINFRVHYARPSEGSEMVSFSARPFELISDGNDGEDPGSFLVYGRMHRSMDLKIGLRDIFKMEDGLHERLGYLYKRVSKECASILNGCS